MAEGLKTKKKIASEFMLLCETQEYGKVSVQDIATKAGINRQTFYYHFSDKTELLRWVYIEDSLRYLSSGELNLSNWEEQTLKMLKKMVARAHFYQKTLLGNRTVLITEFFEIVQLRFQSLLTHVDEENILSDQDILFYSRFFSFGCSGMLETWIREDFRETPLVFATQLFRLAQDVEVFAYRMYQRKEG